MKNLIHRIQKLEMLNLISVEDLSAYVTNGVILIRTYPKESVVHHRFESCETLDVILSGQLTINRFDALGNVVHITQFKKGESLGGNLLFATNHNYPFEISTLEESIVLHINKNTVIELLESNRYFLLSFMTDLSDKSLILTHAIHALSERTLRQKIIQYIEKEMDIQESQTIVMKTSKNS